MDKLFVSLEAYFYMQTTFIWIFTYIYDIFNGILYKVS